MRRRDPNCSENVTCGGENYSCGAKENDMIGGVVGGGSNGPTSSSERPTKSQMLLMFSSKAGNV